jgi:ATP-dependent helicase HrpB
MADEDPLGREPWLVIVETDGRRPESRVFLAASLTEAAVRSEFADRIDEVEVVDWDDERGIRARAERRLGAIVLDTRPVRSPSPERVAAAVADAIRRRGLDILPWTEAATRLRQRMHFLHRQDSSWPDVSDSALLAALPDRLDLGSIRGAAELQRLDLMRAILDLLDWRQRKRIDQVAPTHFEAPTGSRVPIDYADPDAPGIAIRLQEMFGCSTTPAIMEGRVPLAVHLLSPANRPVQVTRDLVGFWRTSYFDVRKDLRARYPKHAWPDDPLSAEPTRRARRSR